MRPTAESQLKVRGARQAHWLWIRPIRSAREQKTLSPKRTLVSRLLAWPAFWLVFGTDCAGVAVCWLTALGSAVEVTLLAATTLALLQSTGRYQPRLLLSVLDDLPALCGLILTALGLTSVLATAGLAPPRVALADLAQLSPVLLVTICSSRALSYALVRSARRRRLVAHPTLLAGGGVVAGQVARALRDHPEYGLDPVAFLDPQPLPNARAALPKVCPTPVLAEAIDELHIKVVIVAFGSVRESMLVEVIRTCDRLNCEIFLVPRLFDAGGYGRETEHVWGIPLVRLRRAAFRRDAQVRKRAFDLVVAGVALILFMPLMVILALTVRTACGPPIFFRQLRTGADGRQFVMLKFRTINGKGDDRTTQWSTPREAISPLGRFLRRTSLDELPQLLNVLRGEMSLVGPRPERPHFVDQFAELYPHYFARHRMRAGLTGLAQVHGLRGDTSIEDRARFDNAYIDNWSLWGDVKILLATASQVLGARGA